MKYYSQASKLDSLSVSGIAASMSGSRRFKGGLTENTNENQQAEVVQSQNKSGYTTVSTKYRQFDEKFKFVKDSAKPEPSLKSFTRLLNLLQLLFLGIFVIGILIVNLYPSPKPYYTFLDELTGLTFKANELIFAARYMLLQQDESVNQGPCSFNPLNSTYPICPWVVSANNFTGKTVPDLKNFLQAVNSKFIETFNSFQAMYMKIRVPGDDLDRVILGNFRIGQFVNQSAESVTQFEVTTLWNVYSLFIASGEVADAQFNITKVDREWNFILTNRYELNSFNLNLAKAIPVISSRILGNLALAHLILFLIFIAAAMVYL